jgi:hypothetical protein
MKESKLSRGDLYYYIKSAIENQTGDDLERAQLAFKGQNLDEQHGQSGMTRRELLDVYQEERSMNKKALAWLEEVSE